MAGGLTERGLGGGRGDAIALTELHEEPHLVIGHMAAGHGWAPRGEDAIAHGRPRSPDDAPSRGHADTDLATSVGLRPPSVTRSAIPLTLIDALLSS